MGGRADYEERKKQRIERYNELSEKAMKRSVECENSRSNQILGSTYGQPVLVGHHSERAHRNLIKRANNDIRKSIEFSNKSKYYKNKAKNVSNSQVIYNDDLLAIVKLKEKLERLKIEKEKIKEREHEKWELNNIGANIRETKLRIERLEAQEKIVYPEIEFVGGRAIHNKKINRIQLIFDRVPDENIRIALKSRGFHWSRKEGAWQREFNENTIKATNILIRDVLNKEQELKDEEEFE